MDNQSMSQERPVAAVASAPYFQNVPWSFLAVFAWFAYLALSALASLSTVLNLFPILSNPSMMESFMSNPIIWYIIFPFVGGMVCWGVLWGLVKQAPWTRWTVGVWYAIYIIFIAWMGFLLTSSFNSYSPFGGLYRTLMPMVVSGIFTFAVNTWAAYYVLRRVKF
jgi:hypothetical protein